MLFQNFFQSPAANMAAFISLPKSAGDLLTLMPAFSMALIFSPALPFPPETMAPA